MTRACSYAAMTLSGCSHYLLNLIISICRNHVMSWQITYGGIMLVSFLVMATGWLRAVLDDISPNFGSAICCCTVVAEFQDSNQSL